MAVQQFCLRWNNHQPNFISVFTDLLNNETLVDVTLAAEGKQLQAHKVVLSACSTYFQSLFTTNPCQHPIVILKDIKYSDLKIMVDFMYYGEVNVSQDQLPAILKTAEALKIKGLAESPEGVSLSKSESVCSGECPWSPGGLRRKRLRKSSTGSSEQTSTEEGGAGGSVGSCSGPSPHGLIKQEPTEVPEGPLPLRDPSTESDSTATPAHDYPAEEPPPLPETSQLPILPRGLSEEIVESNLKWSCEDKANILRPQLPQGGADWEWEPYWEGCGPSGGLLQVPAAAPPRAPRRRSLNPQAEEKFIAALEAVRTGRLGFCKAAKLYGVNNRTLWLEYKRRGYPLLRPSTKSKCALPGVGVPLPPPLPPPQPPPPPSAAVQCFPQHRLTDKYSPHIDPYYFYSVPNSSSNN